MTSLASDYFVMRDDDEIKELLEECDDRMADMNGPPQYRLDQLALAVKQTIEWMTDRSAPAPIQKTRDERQMCEAVRRLKEGLK